MRRFAILAAALAVAWAASSPAIADACRCRPDRRPLDQKVKEAVEAAAAVFVGKATRVVALRPVGSIVGLSVDMEVTTEFAVQKIFKGKIGQTVEVSARTLGDGAACQRGHRFEVGKSYLVFASGGGGRYGVYDTSTCMPALTRLASESGQVLKLLAGIRPPVGGMDRQLGALVSRLVQIGRKLDERRLVSLVAALSDLVRRYESGR